MYYLSVALRPNSINQIRGFNREAAEAIGKFDCKLFTSHGGRWALGVGFDGIWALGNYCSSLFENPNIAKLRFDFKMLFFEALIFFVKKGCRRNFFWKRILFELDFFFGDGKCGHFVLDEQF